MLVEREIKNALSELCDAGFGVRAELRSFAAPVLEFDGEPGSVVHVTLDALFEEGVGAFPEAAVGG
jgi:hypothetical protein